MKPLIRPTLIATIIFLLIFLTISLSGFRFTSSLRINDYASGALTLEKASTPQAQDDRSEVGSTDGITVMSFIIVAIIIIPILLKRRSWSQS
jgi:hypothetical protein